MSSWCWEGWRVCVDFANSSFAILQDPQHSGIASRVYHSIPGFSCQPLSNNTLAAIPMKRLDLAEARASVQADADAIKERIQKEHQSFEYVNQTVEQALWCEVIKFLKQSQQEPEEIELSTQTPQDSDLSTSSAPISAILSADSQCGLQWITGRQPMGAVSRSDKAQVLKFGSQQIDWTLSQSFLSHGP